jgi:hypothetical protein
VYFEVLQLQFNKEIAETIAYEINEEVDFRVRQLHELKELFFSTDHHVILSDKLK